MADELSTGIINNKIESLKRDVHALSAKTDTLAEKADEVARQMNGLNNSMGQMSTQLADLNQRFQQMVQDRARAEALQQATTELIRVRQEIEKNFGNYNIVRDTMLGILQATDLALVKKTTISTVSEELMISTPNYWLAPCLVAVAAWIGDDRDLADRAIAEAVKRNDERTALTMALICRRNGRTQTCYEWLSLYFSKLNAGNFTQGGYTFVDAYINGVFGPDEKHMCDDYINDWLNQIRGSDSEFEKTQEQIWKEYCKRFQVSTQEKYPALMSSTNEFQQIDSCVGRVLSVDSIDNHFKGISEAYVDMDALKGTIDDHLVSIINNYAPEEIQLHDEEKCYIRVKETNGTMNYATAKAELMKNKIAQQSQKISLVEQMTGAVINEAERSPSKKKTAISFLHNYINRGYDSYINENKESFPQAITIRVHQWSGQTTDGNNETELQSSYNAYLDQNKKAEIDVIKKRQLIQKGLLLAGGVCALLGIILAIADTPVLGVLMICAGVACVVFSMVKKKKTDAQLQETSARYQQMQIYGSQMIHGSLEEWRHAQSVFFDFYSREHEKIIA